MIVINIKFISCDFLLFGSYEINYGRIFRDFYILGIFSSVIGN